MARHIGVAGHAEGVPGSIKVEEHPESKGRRRMRKLRKMRNRTERRKRSKKQRRKRNVGTPVLVASETSNNNSK